MIWVYFVVKVFVMILFDFVTICKGEILNGVASLCESFEDGGVLCCYMQRFKQFS